MSPVAGVADTHAALWYLLRHPQLSPAALRFIEDAARDGQAVLISAISLTEIVYLMEKGRLPTTVYRELTTALADESYVLREAPLTRQIVDAMQLVPRAEVPDMPDRLVAATAVHYEVPVISRDGQIRASRIQTIW